MCFKYRARVGSILFSKQRGTHKGETRRGKEKPRQKVEVRKWTVIEAKQIIVISLTKTSNTPWQNIEVTKRNSSP